MTKSAIFEALMASLAQFNKGIAEMINNEGVRSLIVGILEAIELGSVIAMVVVYGE